MRALLGVMLGAVLLLVPLTSNAAGLLIADGGFGGVLEIEEHEVQVTVNNGIAVTTVTQIFRNTENRQVEALYSFPVPKNASVANFSMWIGGKEMVGEVLEKKRAREIYDSYKQQRRDPGLLEQTDYKTFEMRIFPIAAGASQKVQVVYYQELDMDADWATWVYPLATVTRNEMDQRTRGKFALTLDVKSAVPVVELESPSHPEAFAIAQFAPGYLQASLETVEGDLARDVVLAYRTSRANTGVDVITSRVDGEDGFFGLTLTAGEELGGATGGMDYVFVLDVSGGMGRDGKLSLSQDSIGAFIDTLGSEDRFEVIAFNVRPSRLFGNLRDVEDPARDEARSFLAAQQPRGGTVLNPAITAAYGYGDPDRTLNVVILSDGMTEQTERTALLELIRQGPTNARVFAVGVGNEVDRPLLRQVAQDAGGMAAFLSQGDDFERQAQAFRRKLMHPVATNLTITFEGDRVYDVEPRELPNLYHGMPVRMYGRYRGDGPITATISAGIQGRSSTRTVEVDLPRKDAGNPEIERTWAWHRVQRLLAEADRVGDRRDVIDEIVRLGEGFSIVTEYTSFLVLENDAEYRRWKIERKNALRLERDRTQQRQLREELAELRRMDASTERPAEPEPAALPAARPTPTTSSAPSAPSPTQGSRTSPSWDIDFGGGGGGAIDPISGAIGLALFGSVLAMRRGRRDGEEGSDA
jgi:Ca-activated chloride channel family protein